MICACGHTFNYHATESDDSRFCMLCPCTHYVEDHEHSTFALLRAKDEELEVRIAALEVALQEKANKKPIMSTCVNCEHTLIGDEEE